jgi:hypothetical protein
MDRSTGVPSLLNGERARVRGEITKLEVRSPKAETGSRLVTSATAIPNAPSISLSLRFMVTGVLALFIGIGWLVAKPTLLATYHYNQHIIAVTHLFVLGFICSVVMGAMYQLVPVALETRLYSERIAKWQFVFHVIGFAGMVWMFWKWDMKQVGHFGCVLAVGAGLFIYNIVRTLLRVPRWSVVATAITAALVWISLTIIAGLSIATAKCTYESTSGLATAGGVSTLLSGLRSVAGFMSRFDQISAMHAHAHLGVVGFFVMLIVGVSYKLIPMFTLSEIQSNHRAATSIVLLNVGLAGSVVTILCRSPWKFMFALVTITALTIYGGEMLAILRVRKRGTLDWGIRSFLTAVGLLLPLSALAVVLSWPGLPLNEFTGQLENLYGFLGLIGVVTFAILGMLYKILPFLVWYGAYSPHVGRAQLPALADMYSERLQVIGYWSYLAGLAATGAAIVFSNQTSVQTGCALLGLSLLTFGLNAVRILSHFFKPQLRPLAPITPLEKAAI